MMPSHTHPSPPVLTTQLASMLFSQVSVCLMHNGVIAPVIILQWSYYLATLSYLHIHEAALSFIPSLQGSITTDKLGVAPTKHIVVAID